jgi:hypothetical protein
MHRLLHFDEALWLALLGTRMGFRQRSELSAAYCLRGFMVAFTLTLVREPHLVNTFEQWHAPDVVRWQSTKPECSRL